MEYPIITIALLAVLLAIVIWQANSIRRLLGIVGVVRYSQCDHEDSICRLACASARDAVIAGNQISRSLCELERSQGLRDCSVQHVNDPAARDECRRQVEQRFQQCIAPLVAREEQAQRDYEACLRACADKLLDCRRRSLQDATLDRGDLPNKSDLMQPPSPPIDPRG